MQEATEKKGPGREVPGCQQSPTSRHCWRVKEEWRRCSSRCAAARLLSLCGGRSRLLTSYCAADSGAHSTAAAQQAPSGPRNMHQPLGTARVMLNCRVQGPLRCGSTAGAPRIGISWVIDHSLAVADITARCQMCGALHCCSLADEESANASGKLLPAPVSVC